MALILFADAVASKTSSRFDCLFAFLRITRLLLRQLPVNAALPDESRDRLDLIGQEAEVRHLRIQTERAIFAVALLAAGLAVLFIVERPEPEWIPAMSFHNIGSSAAITAVAGRAAETIGSVFLNQLLVRVGN